MIKILKSFETTLNLLCLDVLLPTSKMYWGDIDWDPASPTPGGKSHGVVQGWMMFWWAESTATFWPWLQICSRASQARSIVSCQTQTEHWSYKNSSDNEGAAGWAVVWNRLEQNRIRVQRRQTGCSPDSLPSCKRPRNLSSVVLVWYGAGSDNWAELVFFPPT